MKPFFNQTTLNNVFLPVEFIFLCVQETRELRTDALHWHGDIRHATAGGPRILCGYHSSPELGKRCKDLVKKDFQSQTPKFFVFVFLTDYADFGKLFHL